MCVLIIFCAANFGRFLIVSTMTNMAARPDLHAVTAISETISEIFEDSLNYLAVNQKKPGLGSCYQIS